MNRRIAIHAIARSRGGCRGSAVTAARALRRLPLHLHALAVMAAALVLLPTRGLPVTLRVLARPPRRARTPRRRHPSDRVVRAVQRAGRVLPGTACLSQSVTVAALLTRQGDDCELVIGCRRAAGTWTAHAWVERAGERLEAVPGGDNAEMARCRLATGWRMVAGEGRDAFHQAQTP